MCIYMVYGVFDIVVFVVAVYGKWIIIVRG